MPSSSALGHRLPGSTSPLRDCSENCSITRSVDSASDSFLRTEDFEDDRLQQQIGDLSDAAVFDLHRSLIQETELLFVDRPKDGGFERKLLRQLETVDFHKPLLLVMDDIRFWNMLAIWQDIARPKLDLTSFGHWSGTGLVEWHSGTNSEKRKH